MIIHSSTQSQTETNSQSDVTPIIILLFVERQVNHNHNHENHSQDELQDNADYLMKVIENALQPSISVNDMNLHVIVVDLEIPMTVNMDSMITRDQSIYDQEIGIIFSEMAIWAKVGAHGILIRKELMRLLKEICGTHENANIFFAAKRLGTLFMGDFLQNHFFRNPSQYTSKQTKLILSHVHLCDSSPFLAQWKYVHPILMHSDIVLPPCIEKAHTFACSHIWNILNVNHVTFMKEYSTYFSECALETTSTNVHDWKYEWLQPLIGALMRILPTTN